MQVAAVPPPDVLKWWPLVQPLLDPAITRTNGREDTVSVFASLIKGNYLLWLCWDEETRTLLAACVTQLATYPTGKLYLSILLLGGTGLTRFIVPLVRALEQYADAAGAHGAEIQGRPGWQKILARHGFTPVATALERDLTTHGQQQANHYSE